MCVWEGGPGSVNMAFSGYPSAGSAEGCDPRLWPFLDVIIRGLWSAMSVIVAIPGCPYPGSWEGYVCD